MASISATKLFYSNRNVRSALLTLLISGLLSGSPAWTQVVPVQANMDAQAQRRIQQQAELARRQRRIEDHLQQIVPALDPKNLSGSQGVRTTNKALAALYSLQTDGVSARDALRRAIDCSNLPAENTRAPLNYLLQTWESVAGKMNPTLAQSMRTGDPAPFPISPFQP
jgi:hypothetical protein